MPLTGNQVAANQPFQIAADHTGVNVTQFAAFIDGNLQQTRPAGDLVGGSVTFDFPAQPLGPHVIGVRAANASGPSETVEITVEAVAVPPQPVTNVRVVGNA